jgi:histidyl-tRNA synthetase
MALNTQPYKGARDFYPEDKRVQKWMFGKLREVVERFGYQEYDAPVLEPIDMFLAKTGEEIVNQQLYSFEDRGGRKVAIRPEMTPSVSRMVAARRQELPYPLRWYSIPNLWRYERPQAGRLREHWQLNVDLFGVEDLSADHEMIVIANQVLKAFKAPADSYVIRVNSRAFVEYFGREHLKLDDNQFYELTKLIDRWHKIDREEFHNQAKQILQGEDQFNQLVSFMDSRDLDSLPDEVKNHESAQQLGELMEMLKDSGVNNASFDFSVIRGMDYYNGIVFEVFDTNPENTRSMMGGGRYDGLVGLFGVEPLPTVGFAIGDVTLQRFLELHSLIPRLPTETQATVILIGDVYKDALTAVDDLRSKGLNLAVDNSGRKIDTQIKNAAKSGAPYVIFIGEQELQSGSFKLKNLGSGEETQLPLDQVPEKIKNA